MPSRTAWRASRRPATTARPIATRLSGAASRDFPACTRALPPGARLPAIQQRYMPGGGGGGYRRVHRRILAALEAYDGAPLTYHGRRIVRTWESEAATAPSADILTAVFVRVAYPLVGGVHDRHEGPDSPVAALRLLWTPRRSRPRASHTFQSGPVLRFVIHDARTISAPPHRPGGGDVDGARRPHGDGSRRHDRHARARHGACWSRRRPHADGRPRRHGRGRAP